MIIETSKKGEVRFNFTQIFIELVGPLLIVKGFNAIITKKLNYLLSGIMRKS